MLAGLLNWPQASFASKIEINDNSLLVVREVDGGLETIKTSIPAIVTADLRLNQPRFATLPNIMKAKKKPFSTLLPADLKLDLGSLVSIVEVLEPAVRKGGRKVASVQELVDKLKNEANVI